jgi:hypothetical protein
MTGALKGHEPALSIDCACHLCLKHLSAWVCGSRVVLLEPEPSADGTHALVVGHMLKIVPNDRRGPGTIRAELVGNRQRFRNHEMFCEKRFVSHAAMKPTEPTGVWNRDR